MENASLRDELVEPVSKSAELAAQPLETNNEGGQRPTSEESSPASRPLPPPPPPKRFKPSTDSADDVDLQGGVESEIPRQQEASSSSNTSTQEASYLDSEPIELEIEDTDDEDDLFRRILAAAAARGIPLDFLAAHMNGGPGADSDDEDIEYPFEQPPTSLDDVATFIQSDDCRKILILAGAGMSVASGIPDFRSSNGLYATLDADKLTCFDPFQRERIRQDPSYCLDQHLFLENPLPCLEVNREFILGVRDRKWKATLAHRFVEYLCSATKPSSKLCRLYTQNIDGLEDQCSTLPDSKRIAVHGSMDQAECAVCGEMYPNFDEFCRRVKTQIKDITGQDPNAPTESTPIRCPFCNAPSVKPAIVLFRSSLPKEFFRKVPDDVKDVDLLIIIGTSLHVAPANSLVWRVPKRAMRVLVNREAVGWHLGLNFDHNDRDFLGQGDCEQVCLDLIEKLGWLPKLQPLMDQNEIPASSAKLLRDRLAEIEQREQKNASGTAQGLQEQSDEKSNAQEPK